MNLIIFEDEFVNQLFPITTGRLAYNISCAGFRLIDWLDLLNVQLHGQVRPHMRTIQEMDFPQIREPNSLGEDNRLFINARTVPSKTNFDVIKTIIDRNRYGIVKNGDSIAAALLPYDHQGIIVESNGVVNSATISPERMEDLPVLGSELSLFYYPHEVVQQNVDCFDENIKYKLEAGEYEEFQDGVFVAEGAKIGQYCVTDTSEGPIIVEKNAKIGPYCFLAGPAIIGENSKVIEHSAIKDYVSLAHTTKIGGEIEASVIEPYTNKQHHGFLGHSYLGSWINLGAGTCNSDLKNTYGEVKMDYGGNKVPSKMQFLGCIMGDYSKSAINTGIFTGKIIGVCSMVYGFVTTNVPSFVNYARLFGQVTELPPQVMVATQKRMFLRRNVPQRACDAQLLKDMYNLTIDERQLAGEPLSL